MPSARGSQQRGRVGCTSSFFGNSRQAPVSSSYNQNAETSNASRLATRNQATRCHDTKMSDTVDLVPESDPEDDDITETPSMSKGAKRPLGYDEVSIVNETQPSVVNETQSSVVNETQRSVLYETQVSMVAESQSPDIFEDSFDSNQMDCAPRNHGVRSPLRAGAFEPPTKRARTGAGQQKIESFFETQQKSRTSSQTTTASQRTFGGSQSQAARLKPLKREIPSPDAPTASAQADGGVELRGIGRFSSASGLEDEKPSYMDNSDMKKFMNKSVVVSQSLVRKDKPLRIDEDKRNFNNFRKAPQGRFFVGKDLSDIIRCTSEYVPKCPSYSSK